jgi:Beta/Gamma crystallin
MNSMLRTLLLAAGILVAGQAAAQVTFYENDGFAGRTFTADRTIWNFDRLGFNDMASSATVRGGSWEVCTDARFEGRCIVLRPGDYPSLRALGLNDRISSVRQVGNDAYSRNDNSYDGRNDRRMYGNPNPDRYEYRNDGWRYDRWNNQWERY